MTWTHSLNSRWGFTTIATNILTSMPAHPQMRCFAKPPHGVQVNFPTAASGARLKSNRRRLTSPVVARHPRIAESRLPPNSSWLQCRRLQRPPGIEFKPRPTIHLPLPNDSYRADECFRRMRSWFAFRPRRASVRHGGNNPSRRKSPGGGTNV